MNWIQIKSVVQFMHSTLSSFSIQNKNIKINISCSNMKNMTMPMRLDSNKTIYQICAKSIFKNLTYVDLHV